jgi:hypothetical protein
MRHFVAAHRSGRGCHSRPDVRLPSRTQPATQLGYAKFYSRSHDAVIRVYDDAGNVIQTHEHKGVEVHRPFVAFRGKEARLGNLDRQRRSFSSRRAAQSGRR